MTDELDNSVDEAEDFDVFDDEQSDTEDEAEEEAKPDGKEETDEDSKKTEEDSKGDNKSEPPSEENENKSVPVGALTSERQKRQQAEEELKVAREKLASYEQKAADVPDPTKDPEGYKKFLEDESKVKEVKRRIDLSREIMVDSFTDYEQMEAIYNEMVAKDISIHERMTASKNPAKFAYDIGKKEYESRVAKQEAEKEQLKQQLLDDEDFLARAKEKILGKDSSVTTKKSVGKALDLTGATAIGSNSEKIETIDDDDDLFEDSYL